MTLDLNGYIKQSYKRPNRQVLESLGANERLIEYLMETPGNTNWQVVEAIGNSGDEEAEVWFVSDTSVEQEGLKIFTFNNDGITDHITELYDNSGDYKVYLNGEELPYYQRVESGSYIFIGWTDTEEVESSTKNVSISDFRDIKTVQVVYMDASTAPTSVEVSVEHK